MNALRATLGTLLATSMLVLLLVVAGWPLQVRVVAPRLGSPWIDQPATTMEVRLVSSMPFVLPTMELSLEGAGGTASLSVTARRWDGPQAVLTTLLPNLPDGGYTLHVRTASQRLVSSNAVFLRREWPALLRLVHITDLPRPGHEARLRQFVEQMRRDHPDAVLLSGDFNYTNEAASAQFVYEQLMLLNAPVIATAGNHERQGWYQFLHLYAARNHRTNLGPLAILSVDSAHSRDALTPSTFRWLQRELTRLEGRTPLIQIHHPVFPPGPSATPDAGGTGGYLRGYRRGFIALCARHNVPIVLSGHWHQDAVFDRDGNVRSDLGDFPGTKYVITTTLGESPRKVFEQSPVRRGYRWIEFANGQLVSYSSHPGNPAPTAALGTP